MYRSRAILLVIACLALLAALPATAMAKLSPQETALSQSLMRGLYSEAFTNAMSGNRPPSTATIKRIFRTTDATVVVNTTVNPMTLRFACSSRYTAVVLYNRRTKNFMAGLVKNGRLLGFEERAGTDYGYVRGRCVNGRMSLRTLAG